jgi:hypothetical protein
MSTPSMTSWGKVKASLRKNGEVCWDVDLVKGGCFPFGIGVGVQDAQWGGGSRVELVSIRGHGLFHFSNPVGWRFIASNSLCTL